MNFIEDLKMQLASYYETMIAILPRLALALLVCTLMALFFRTIRKKVVRHIKLKAEDKLLANFVDRAVRIIGIIIIFLLFLYIVDMKGIASSILGAAGVSAFIIGFAFKDIAENFLAGVIMAFKRPFRLGDTIKSGDIEGTIIAMNLRDSQIKTADGKDVYIPNSMFLKNPLFNYTIDGFLRGSFIIGIDYEADVEKARAIILDVLSKIPGILDGEKNSRTHVKLLNVSTVDIEVFYWINTFDNSFSGLELKSIAQAKCVEALTKAGIGLPASIVEVVRRENS